MDLVTIVCKRDVVDAVLQAHTIDKFVENPITHYVTIEDRGYTSQEWYDLLSPHYTKHTLRLIEYPRDDILDVTPPFSQSGRYGHGWRRQQYLKLLTTAEHVTTSHALVLDSKNIFVRHVDTNNWPVKHGNGAYLTRESIFSNKNHYVIKDWLLYFSEKTGKPIPEKFGRLLETPFVFETKIVKQMAQELDLVGLFLNRFVMPNSEFHTYMFYVDPSELPEEKDLICNAMSPFDFNPGSHDTLIRNDVRRCIEIDSPTHGLHRTVREDSPEDVKKFYTEWLLSLKLDEIAVKNYMSV